MATITTSIRIPVELQARYERLAATTQRSRNYHIVEALERYACQELSDIERIEEALAQAQRGEFVPDEEMDAFFTRFRTPEERAAGAAALRAELGL